MVFSGLPRNKICMVLEALFWHIFLRGIMQPLLALSVALIICPLASLVVFIGKTYAALNLWYA